MKDIGYSEQSSTSSIYLIINIDRYEIKNNEIIIYEDALHLLSEYSNGRY